MSTYFYSAFSVTYITDEIRCQAFYVYAVTVLHKCVSVLRMKNETISKLQSIIWLASTALGRHLTTL